MHSTMNSTLESTDEEKAGRWSGRNVDKDALRREIWERLEETGVNVGPVWSRISNWVGADEAAWRLSQLPVWKQAKIVKCNPDPPQIPVRLRALYDGKIVYVPVPEFGSGDLPWVKLDPEKLSRDGVQFELAATSQGSVQVGEKLSFEALEPIDLAVCGCVAVTRAGGRTGKGGGFADLELGLFRDLGKITPETPIVTTVHSSMVVDDDRLPIMEHDSLLHWIVTEKEVIETKTMRSQAGGVIWELVLPDQFEEIWFLKQLKEDILARKAGQAAE
ncbi:5-formyltetrahydrofolate cyclo-ligase family protein [Hartmannibacter diazotrophicus]|uniref:5-formyltetrahydrofolate cyclo-ligase family protein n=1 Tax=Hartmannibacter diazotrophicus TaxID=1482074 RepID=A0A2C9DA13_9HYPH|nr:5-formyltetrahydrofolate cyclo-ligase [Hartmannibacter diazotrophicus]SON56978.1 5-formyltetrahydrofolate cyclo-ligase family protein [Hartmannibacter diazotrophicus]